MAGLNLFTNNAATTLASGISNVATSLTVAAGTGSEFPTLAGSEYFYCTIANNAGAIEIIKVTARSTDTFTIVRGQDGTSGTAWSAGDKVELRLNRIDLLNFPQLDSTNTFATTQTFTAAPVFTDQAGTRTAITAAKSGANSDITSITGLTTALTVAQGGTNNASLATTAGGTLYTDGSKVVNVGAGTTGQYLKSNGASAPAWATLSTSGGLININYYKTAGTATYTKATNNPSFIVVEVIGAGGGGGGGSAPLGSNRYGAGGGGGGYARRKIAASSLASSETVTVGAGVTGGSSNATGGTGGTSSFGTFASATGGAGGAPSNSATGGAAGLGSSGDLNLNGGYGQNSGGINAMPGLGGSSIFGFSSSSTGAGATVSTMPPGSGGNGSSGNNTISANGIVIVYEYS